MNNNDSTDKLWLPAEPVRSAIKVFFLVIILGTSCTIIFSPEVFYRNPSRVVIQVTLVALIGAILLYLEGKKVMKKNKGAEQ